MKLRKNYLTLSLDLLVEDRLILIVFIEAIADAAVLGGMKQARCFKKWLPKTVLGAARMIEETQCHPGELKDAVCSGGGSTIHGIHALESAGMRGAVMDAVKAATERSKELGKQLNDASVLS